MYDQELLNELKDVINTCQRIHELIALGRNKN